MTGLIYLITFIILVIATIIAINFHRLKIKIYPNEICISYGIFQRKIRLDNIRDYTIDEGSSFVKYWGWGIRIKRVNKKWRLVYNTREHARILLFLKAGRFKQFVFSCKNPNEILQILKQNID